MLGALALLHAGLPGVERVAGPVLRHVGDDQVLLLLPLLLLLRYVGVSSRGW